MESLKLLIISSPGVQTPPIGYGAVEQISYNIAVGMHKRGHQVTIVVSSDSDETKYPEGIRVIKTVPSKIRPIPEEESFRDYMTKLAKDLSTFAIVHDNSHMQYSYILRKNGLIKHSVHNITDDVPKTMEKPPVKFPCMITSSYATCRRITEACQDIVCRTAWYGVDTSMYYPREVEKSNRFLFVGRIQSIKGIHLLIDLCKNFEIPLDIAGFDETPGQEDYVKAVKNMCDGRLVRYLGNVTQEVKCRMMSAAKALIVPSLFHETFGMVVSEAMACGTPVIVSGMGALREQVSEGITGYVFEHFNQIPHIIEQLDEIKPPDWSWRCRNHVQANFTVERQNDRYESLYKDIIEGREW